MSKKYKKSQPSIILIEDDITISKMIQYNLTKAGYKVYAPTDNDNIISFIKVVNPDLILLDWVLPGLQGTTLCSLLCKDQDTANIPIIMISSRKDELDKVFGLEHGADDYITKPISPVELIARIKAVLRRVNPNIVTKKLNYLDIELDLNACSVTRNGQIVKLSPVEFQILKILIEYPKKVFSRDIIIEKIWKDNIDVDDKTINVHITRLRKHLNAYGVNVIKTVRTMGYKLE